jgi:hypothetical protein
MGLDNVFVLIVFVGLLLGFLSLLIGKFFLRRRHPLHAADSLWYATLILIFCLGVTVFVLNWRTRDLEEEVRFLREELESMK